MVVPPRSFVAVFVPFPATAALSLATRTPPLMLSVAPPALGRGRELLGAHVAALDVEGRADLARARRVALGVGAQIAGFDGAALQRHRAAACGVDGIAHLDLAGLVADRLEVPADRRSGGGGGVHNRQVPLADKLAGSQGFAVEVKSHGFRDVGQVGFRDVLQQLDRLAIPGSLNSIRQ